MNTNQERNTAQAAGVRRMEELIRLLEALCGYGKQEGNPIGYAMMETLKEWAEEYIDALDEEREACGEEDFLPLKKEMQMRMVPLGGFFEDADYLEFYIDVFRDEAVRKYVKEKNFYRRHRLQKFSYKKLHQRIAKRIFENIAHNRTKVYVQLGHNDAAISGRSLIAEDENELDGYIRLSLISEEALDHDRSIFAMLRSRDQQLVSIIRQIYKPYFMEYYVRSDQLTRLESQFVSQPSDADSAMRGWYSAILLEENGNQIGGEGQTYEGVCSFSASPVFYENRKICIADKRVDNAVMEKIESTYRRENSTASDDDIKNAVQGIFGKEQFQKVRIYRVGNGNCIYCRGTSKRLLYDIGFDNKTAVREDLASMKSSYTGALARIRHILPDCVILSHWDEDHYKACVYARKELYDCLWIAPDFYDAGINAKRLGMYLSSIKKLLLVSRSGEQRLQISLNPDSRLTLYVGRKSPYITRQNCEGIAVKIENKADGGWIQCLLMGDVPYSSLPPEAGFQDENPYDYLVAPHHGSKMKYDLLEMEKEQSSGTAVICCSNHPGKNRPAPEHQKLLAACYARVKTTEQEGDYIEFDLTRKSGAES